MPNDETALSLGMMLGREAARRGISHARAGAELGTTQATFSRWVAGSTFPTASYWPAIARFLKISRTEVTRRASNERQTRTRFAHEDRLARIEDDLAELKRMMQRLIEHLERA
jgi:hypothetical protein